jgi:MerR family transcriptional regulator, copper efflux regulator
VARERRYRVGELAHLCDVNPRTVDYYTTAGLLAPVARSPGGHRLYDDAAARRLRVVKLLQAQGLPLGAIRARLEAPGGDAGVLPHVEQLRAELRRLEGEVAALAPQLAAATPEDEQARGALRASLAGAASYAAALAQELLGLLSAGMFGLL